MKLKHDCIREVMLYLEEKLELNNIIMSNNIKISKYSLDDITYTIMKLNEAGFINCKFCGYDNVIRYSVSSITWNGHLFLDNIRDNKVWKTTKGIISKFSSISITMIENIASQVISNLISSNMAKS